MSRASSAPPLVVPDASALVKAFRREAGSDEVIALLERHGREEIRLVLPAMAIEETLNVARRELGVPEARIVWAGLRDMEAAVVGLDDVIAQAAFDVCEEYGCTFYDAVAPAIARLVSATLWSGDRRAHAKIPGAVLVG